VELYGANHYGVNGRGGGAFYRAREVVEVRGGGRPVKWRLTLMILTHKGEGEEGWRQLSRENEGGRVAVQFGFI
jgi:hypothetical protein